MSNGATYRLRPAHAFEAGAIATMSRLLVEHGLRWRWTPKRIRRAIEHPETMVLLATCAGDIVGFAVMKFGEREAHLLLLAVRPADRRAGVGRALLDWLEKSARTSGLFCIRLEVRSGNTAARTFYRRLGYRYLGQVPGYYDSVESAAVFGKQLIGAPASASS